MSLVRAGFLCHWLDQASFVPVYLVRADLLGDKLTLESEGSHSDLPQVQVGVLTIRIMGLMQNQIDSTLDVLCGGSKLV